jgi:hypothetical protein
MPAATGQNPAVDRISSIPGNTTKSIVFLNFFHFWQFRIVLTKTERIDRIPYIPGNPIKSIVFLNFFHFWQLLAISSETGKVDWIPSIPGNPIKSIISLNFFHFWQVLAVLSKTERVDRIASIPGNPIKSMLFLNFLHFWRFLTIPSRTAKLESEYQMLSKTMKINDIWSKNDDVHSRQEKSIGPLLVKLWMNYDFVIMDNVRSSLQPLCTLLWGSGRAARHDDT